MNVDNFTDEVISKKRFEFGKNWKKYLRTLSEQKILIAENSLREMLEVDDLKNKSFLDIGSGSGLFSLAARNLGARVVSFDYDDSSVWCTNELKKIYYNNDNNWKIMEGSVLDKNYLKSLGKFDYVYSWGVLHHTGDMWQALENIVKNVKINGVLFIALYNYQPYWSRYWLFVKKTYVSLYFSRPFWIVLHGLHLTLPSALYKLFFQKNNRRAMSAWYDLLDWLGGYPFEVASPEKIFELYKAKGFELTKLKTASGKIGCNEFVFNNAKKNMNP